MRVLVRGFVAGWVLAAGVGICRGQSQRTTAAIGPLDRQMTGLAGEVCPVWLSAERQATGGAVRVGLDPAADGARVLGDGAALGRRRGAGVAFQITASKPIASVRVEVRYRRLVAGLTPAATGMDRGLATRVVAFTFEKGLEQAEVSGKVLTGVGTTARQVHLLDIAYADGTRWEAPNANSCTVTPDSLMLVATR